MGKVVTIHQPVYIPYMGFFKKVSDSDVFIIYDDAPYSKTANQDWNTLKLADGNPHRIKIPIDTSNGCMLSRVRTKDELGWKEKHLKTVQMNYARAPYFHGVYEWFGEHLMASYDSLAEMNTAMLRSLILMILHDPPKIVLSSEIGGTYDHTDKTGKLVELVTQVRGTDYLSGGAGRNYLDAEQFYRLGIDVAYNSFKAVEYPQLWGDFIPNMSVLDYLMNCGFTDPEGIAWESE